MLPDDSLDALTTPLARTSSSLPSFQLLAKYQNKKECRDLNESNASINSTTLNVSRHTTLWGWVIVFSSFCVHFVADGVLFSFGILMHVIKDDLKVELHTVGIIASLFISLPLFLAPIASALVNKVGCRLVIMLGGLLCSTGLFLASILGNFPGAVIGIGVCCGMGLACVYVPAVVIVAHYFDENRAIATAIAVGGTGLGNAVVAQLIHALNAHYDDWRDTSLFLSGVMFTIVGFGALFRPVEFYIRRTDINYDPVINDHSLQTTDISSTEKSRSIIQETDKRYDQLNQDDPAIHTPEDIPERAQLSLFDSYSADDIKKLTKDQSIAHININICLENISINQCRQALKSLSEHHKNLEKQLLEVYNQPLSQKDIFYPGNVPLKSSSVPRKSCPNLLQSYVYEDSVTSISDDDDDDDDTGDFTNKHHHKQVLFYHRGLSFLHTLRRMLGLHLFRDYRYVIFFISQFLFYLFYDLIYLFPVDYGESVIGYSKQQMTMLITVLGLGQFFGQILFGVLANYSCISDLILYDIGAVLCGVSSLLIPVVAYSYVSLMLVILLFGLSVSANYALTSVILANMCGLEALTSAYGLILLGQGLSSLSGPILGGWIAEKYGYKSSLIVAGIFMGVSGLVTLLIPVIQRLRRNQDDTNNERTTKTSTKTSV